MNERVRGKEFLAQKQRKMPYSMLQGMQKKSVDRFKDQKESDRQLGIVAESGRNKKMMQGYFERRHTEAREDKLARKDTSNRGLNLHRHTEMKYKNGALNISKHGMHQFMSNKE
tara:strand:+ start:173 stop:514 length:342 start_codon:yes stop_codon:yes gene_type:complete